VARKNDKLAKLEEAIGKQAASLEPAQHNFVMVQFDHYKWNELQIADLEVQLKGGVVDEEGFHNYDAEGKLFRQRHQLVAEQGQLFSHIMRWLKDTGKEEEPNELDEYI